MRDAEAGGIGGVVAHGDAADSEGSGSGLLAGGEDAVRGIAALDREKGFEGSGGGDQGDVVFPREGDGALDVIGMLVGQKDGGEGGRIYAACFEGRRGGCERRGRHR